MDILGASVPLVICDNIRQRQGNMLRTHGGRGQGGQKHPSGRIHIQPRCKGQEFICQSLVGTWVISPPNIKKRFSSPRAKGSTLILAIESFSSNARRGRNPKASAYNPLPTLGGAVWATEPPLSPSLECPCLAGRLQPCLPFCKVAPAGEGR